MARARASSHIGLWVDKLEESVAWLKSRGVRFAGEIRVGAAGHKVAFIHPKGNAESPIGGAGVLIELVQVQGYQCVFAWGLMVEGVPRRSNLWIED